MNALTIKLHYIMLPVVSFAMNLYWWVCHLNRLPRARRNKRKVSVTCGQDVIDYMAVFKWRAERVEWRPWVLTIIANDLSDDCDGAALYGKWLIEKWGKRGMALNLWKRDSYTGHSVCYCPESGMLISNGCVDVVDKIDWKENILRNFDYDYDIISMNGKIIYDKGGREPRNN